MPGVAHVVSCPVKGCAGVTLRTAHFGPVRYRRAARGVSCGAKFSVARPGRIAVGDALRVKAWAATGPVPV